MKDSLEKRQNDFVDSIEGLGDILVYETSNKKNKNVIDRLRSINDINEQLLRTENEDFITTAEFKELNNKNKTEAGLQLEFHPEKHLSVLYAPLDQIRRVFEESITSNNEEVAYYASVFLINPIRILSSLSNRAFFIKKFILYARKTASCAIDNDITYYNLLAGWYFDSVIDNYKREICPEYLDILNKNLSASLRTIIKNKKTNALDEFLEDIYHRAANIYSPRSEVWEYGHLLMKHGIEKYKIINDRLEIEKDLFSLSSKGKKILTFEDYKQWLDGFKVLQSKVDPLLLKKDKPAAKKLVKKAQSAAVERLIRSGLEEIMFLLGAYCVFRFTQDGEIIYGKYIKQILEWNQPGDTQVNFMTTDFIPRSINTLSEVYFRSLRSDRGEFLEGHHGEEFYFERYYLIQLMVIISKLNYEPDTQTFKGIEKMNVPDVNIHRLREIETSAGELIASAKNLKKEIAFFKEIGIDKANLTIIIDKGVIPILEELKSGVVSKINSLEKDTGISSEEKELFKRSLLSNFKTNASFRPIYAALDLFKDRTSYKKKDAIPFGIDYILDKAMFFKDWFVSYSGYEQSYAEAIAETEDKLILSKLIGSATKTSDPLDDVVGKSLNKNNLVIIATSHIARENTRSSNYFIEKEAARDHLYEEIESLEGFLRISNSEIPIFSIFSDDYNSGLLVLDKEKMGVFAQYSAKISDDFEKDEILFFNIKAFSEDEDLLEKYLKAPDIKKIKGIEKRRNFLEKKALVQVYESMFILDIKKGNTYIELNFDE